jgi:lipopolysaccharide transport system permease protein
MIAAARNVIGSLIAPRANWSAMVEVTRLMLADRRLVAALALREIRDRYVGELLGSFWAVGHPLFLIGLYVFVFSFVFKVKLGGTVDMPLDYTAYILSGLIPWLAVQDAMSRSCTAVVGSANLVKQMAFRSEFLAVKVIATALFSQVITVSVLLVYVLLTHGAPLATWWLLLPLAAFQVVAMLGLGFLLSSVTVFLRDVKDLVALFAMAGPFLIPAFYLPEWVPAPVRPLLALNPFSHMVWCYQDALYFGRIEHPGSWLIFPLLSLMSYALGYRVFRKLKPWFGNVL